MHIGLYCVRDCNAVDFYVTQRIVSPLRGGFTKRRLLVCTFVTLAFTPTVVAIERGIAPTLDSHETQRSISSPAFESLTSISLNQRLLSQQPLTV